MLIAILNILFFCFGIYSILSKKINYFLFTLIYFSTSLFGFFSPYTDYGFREINNSDIAILLLLFGIIVLPKKNNLIRKHRFYGTFQKIINFFIIYVVGLIFYDIFFTGNSLSNVLIESRIYLFLLILKLINRIDLKNTFTLINSIAVIISIKSVIYVSQYIFNIEIFDTTEFLLSVGKFSGFSTFSPLAIIFLLNKSKKISGLDIFYICFLVLSSLFLGSSGYIIVNFTVLLCWFYFQKRTFKFGFILLSIIPILIFTLIFTSQTVSNDGISDDISADYTEMTSFFYNYSSSNDVTEFYHGGSFQFRLAMFAERLFYLIDNNRLFWGDGFIPDSKLTSQIFILGTHTDNYSFGIEQYNSADVLYVNLICRFGLIGSIFFIGIFIYLLKFKKYSKFFILSVLFFLFMCSLNSDFLYRMSNFVLLFLLIFSEIEYRLINTPKNGN
jgi:hypothetical protein